MKDGGRGKRTCSKLTRPKRQNQMQQVYWDPILQKGKKKKHIRETFWEFGNILKCSIILDILEIVLIFLGVKMNDGYVWECPYS